MQDLQLDKQDRQIVMKGRMKRKGNTSSEASDLQVFLFDHYLVFAKIKYVDYLETYKAYRKVNIYIYIKRERESIYLLLFLFKAYTTWTFILYSIHHKHSPKASKHTPLQPIHHDLDLHPHQ